MSGLRISITQLKECTDTRHTITIVLVRVCVSSAIYEASCFGLELLVTQISE